MSSRKAMTNAAAKVQPGKVQGKVLAKEVPFDVRSFSLAFSFIIMISVSMFIIQKLHPGFSFSPGTFLSSVVLGFMLTPVVAMRKRFFDLATSFQYAIALLSTVLFATVLGTLILQNVTLEEYVNVYGPTLASLIQILFLNDLFHSFWYLSLIALMAISLLLVVVKRKPFRLSQIGFLFTHFGVIGILLGALIGVLR